MKLQSSLYYDYYYCYLLLLLTQARIETLEHVAAIFRIIHFKCRN